MLYCRQDTKGIHYSVRFAPTVTDGTPCRQGVNGVCVDGKCEVSRPYIIRCFDPLIITK